MQPMKVRAEVVGAMKPSPFKKSLIRALNKMKLLIAVALDLVDLVMGNIPLLNTAWDFVTVFVLLLILRNKTLAFIALAELPLIGLPPFGLLDALIPMATLLTLADIAEAKFHVRHHP